MKKKYVISICLCLLAILLIGGVTVWRFYAKPVSTAISRTFYGTLESGGEPVEIAIDGEFRNYVFGNKLDYFERPDLQKGHLMITFRDDYPYAYSGIPRGWGYYITNRDMDFLAVYCYLDENGEPLEWDSLDQGTPYLFLGSTDPTVSRDSLADTVRQILKDNPQWMPHMEGIEAFL